MMTDEDIDRALNAPIDTRGLLEGEVFPDPETLAHPHAFFEEARAVAGNVFLVEKAEILGRRFPFMKARDGKPVYVALGFDVVQSILANQAHYHQNYDHSANVLMGETQLAGLNPPRHRSYRSLVNKAFGVGAMGAIEAEMITPIAQALVERISEAGKADLVPDFACRLPVTLIGHMFDLPLERYADFSRLAGAIMANMTDWKGAVQASSELHALFTVLIAERRQNPGEDLISKLLQAEIEGERLDDEDVITFCRALVPAGIDTTVRALSSLFTGLLGDRRQWELVRDDPSLIPAAVDELLRWNGPAQILPKRTTTDVQLGGVDIPAGSHVWAYIGNANNDPSRWERPYEYDLTRERKNHLAFSFGPHLCLGNQLARRELETALGLFVAAFPDLRLDPDAPAPRISGIMFRSPPQVRVLTR